MQSPIELLNQEFQKRRERNPHFSLRAFAKWLSISPAQLSQMMTGKRPITLKSFRKMSDRLGLSPTENKNLIHFMLEEKSLIETPTEKKVTLLKEDQFRVISDWYHFSILSLTKIKGAKSDPRWIASRLGISVEEANQAVLRLERMRILETKPQFRQISEPLEALSTVPSPAIRKYHKQSLNLAIEKIDTVPVELREYQSISIPLSLKQLPQFKKHIDAFLEQANDLSLPKESTEVYNLNVQLFPVTLNTNEVEK